MKEKWLFASCQWRFQTESNDFPLIYSTASTLFPTKRGFLWASKIWNCKWSPDRAQNDHWKKGNGSLQFWRMLFAPTKNHSILHFVRVSKSPSNEYSLLIIFAVEENMKMLCRSGDGMNACPNSLLLDTDRGDVDEYWNMELRTKEIIIVVGKSLAAGLSHFIVCVSPTIVHFLWHFDMF